MNKPYVRDRQIEYSGNSVDHDIVIGNYGNARIQVSGKFDLKGVIFCPSARVELFVEGTGNIKFSGTCQELVIQQIQGDCIVNLSEFVSRKVRCERLSAPSKLVLGRIRSLEIISVDSEAALEYTEQPAIVNQALLRVA